MGKDDARRRRRARTRAPDPALAEPGSLIEPPCGCLLWTQGDTFMIRPCSPGCPVWAYTRRSAARQGKVLLDWYGPKS